MIKPSRPYSRESRQSLAADATAPASARAHQQTGRVVSSVAGLWWCLAIIQVSVLIRRGSAIRLLRCHGSE